MSGELYLGAERFWGQHTQNDGDVDGEEDEVEEVPFAREDGGHIVDGLRIEFGSRSAVVERGRLW